MKRALFVAGLISLLLASTLNAQTIRRSGRHTFIEIEKEFDVGSGGKLSVTGARADVVVTGWAGQKVAVHAVVRMKRASRREAKEMASRAESVCVQHGNVVAIEGDRLSDRDVNSRFEVRVPREFNVDVNTVGGNVSLTDLTGEQRVRVSGGDVDLRQIRGAAEISTAGGDIAAEDLSGRVRLKTSGGDVRVERTDATLTVRTSGGDIDLRRLKGPVSAVTSGGDILAVESKDDLRLKTAGGNIRVEDAEAQVEAFTSGGDISVIRCVGRVLAKTSGGDIRLRRVGEARVSTSGGDVVAETVTGGVQASTSGGDMRFTEIDGFAEAKTSGGDITVELTPSDYRVDHHVRLETSGGDIQLSIPKDLPATVHAVIETRSSSIDDYELRSDFPLDISKHGAVGRRARGEIRGVGDINGGGDRIELRTVEGNITIRSLP